MTAAPASVEVRSQRFIRSLGLDVASYQHGASLDWSQVKAAGQDFPFVKVTEGSRTDGGHRRLSAGPSAACGKSSLGAALFP